MKKAGIISALFVLIIAVLLSGCGNSQSSANIRSILRIDDGFAGSRSIEMVFPSNMNREGLETALRENVPAYDGDSSAYTLSQPVIANDGNIGYTFEIKFSSKEDYERKISALIGREMSVSIAQPNNILTRGIRFAEDFSVRELVNWAAEALADSGLDGNLNYEYINQADISGSLYTSESEELNIKGLEGDPIESIKIDTVNTKDGRYERRFTFTVSNEVQRRLGDGLSNYFLSLTDERADFNGWSLRGDNQEYMVIYQGLDITALREVTDKMLDVTDGEVFYGDRTNASTPLSEGMDFEEELNLSNFFSEGGEEVPLIYTYSLPTDTTYGDGQIYSHGQWETAGEWAGSAYTYSGSSNTLKIKISDGIQYRIEGINYTLTNNGDGTFVKNMDFLYSSTDGQKAQSYAYNYFSAKGANVSKLEYGGYVVCRLIVEGTPLEMSVQTVDLFGAGNYTDYDTEEPGRSLTVNTTFRDYINISYLLNANNQSVPINYTVLSGSGEALRELGADSPSGNVSTARPDESGNFTVTFTGGQAEITYYGATPNMGSVISYTIFCVILIAAVGAVIFLMLRKDGFKIGKIKKKTRGHAAEGPEKDAVSEFTDNFDGEDDD